MAIAAKPLGRVIGALLLLQMAGLMAGFILLKPGVGVQFLAEAAPADASIRAAVMLLLLNAALALGIGIAARGKLRERSPSLATALVATGVIWVVIQLVDNIHILSMLSLSHQYADSGRATPDLFKMLGEQVRSTRLAAHYSGLLVTAVWFAIFYGILFLDRLVPRPFAAISLLAVGLHMGGIGLSYFLGYPTAMPLAYGLALSYLLIAGWLLAKGFPENPSPAA